MRIIFRLRYHTRFGQSLYLTGNHDSLGSGLIEASVPLRYVDAEFWEATVNWPDDSTSAGATVYNYILCNADGSVIQDWGCDRILPAASTHRELLIIDSWNDAWAVQNTFYTEPFKEVLLKANRTVVPLRAPHIATHTFKVKAPLLAKGQTLCLLGNVASLGNWSTRAPALLSRAADEDCLSVQLDLRDEVFPIQYKYGIYDFQQRAFVQYEEGENRMLHDAVSPGKRTIISDGFIRLPAETWRGAGVAIPVFSLRSGTSFGVGEFSDLRPLADWCQRVGLKLIQILPVNDTSATHTWVDSYPYAAISAFALHPLYLNLDELAGQVGLPEELRAERRRLNALEAVDYEAVMQVKLRFARSCFPKQESEIFSRPDYREFFRQNRHWLEPYAAFCALRDKYGTADFGQWPAHRVYRANEVAQLSQRDAGFHGEIELNYFLQFHLHLQLQAATKYAHDHGVIVKGDIAIGVFRHGADVWQHPDLFHSDRQAGAPPDAFAAKGQNWGFPTYNWERMKEDGYTWWKQRFEQMSTYFDAFRIDHILGFFRIWSSPAHAVEGILGHFVPAIPVGADEFGSRGIAFDRDRLVKPFITDVVLREVFGAEAEHVRREFLVAEASGHLSLKPDFNTQQKVERHFAGLDSNEANQRLKEGLFDLISNVILFEIESSQGRELHFRFALEDTPSFKHLDPQTQAKLKALYVDYFYHRQDEMWMREGRQKLPALKRVTNMLICGEDLGMVPPCVPQLMRELGLLSLEIQRMPKEMHREFSRPAAAPYLSVVTPSTHDMSTIRGWWEEDRALTQKFYRQELKLPGDAPIHCEPSINLAIVQQHLASPAMWSIFQLQDLLGIDGQLRRQDVAVERINVPANPRNYWRYRMHLTLGELLQADGFNNLLAGHVTQSNR